MDILADIRHKLTQHFTPTGLDVRDDSVQHYGHDGATPGTVSHVAIRITAEAFEEMSRVARSRAVFAVIKDEVAAVHAITRLETLTPQEATAKKL